MPRLAFFAIKDILPGEELTFDYKNKAIRNQKKSINIEKALDENLPGIEQMLTDTVSPVKSRLGSIRCLCGSSNCRKYIFV